MKLMIDDAMKAKGREGTVHFIEKLYLIPRVIDRGKGTKSENHIHSFHVWEIIPHVSRVKIYTCENVEPSSIWILRTV